MRLPLIHRLPSWAHTPVHDTVSVVAISVVVASALMAFEIATGLSATLSTSRLHDPLPPIRIDIIRRAPVLRRAAPAKSAIQKRLELRRARQQ